MPSGSPQSHKPLLAISLVVLILATIAIAGVATADPEQTPADAAQASHRAATMSIPF